MNMYIVAGDCPSNEELALRIQGGDRKAAELLISQNEGYLTELALKHTEWCEIEDLKQEGAMALLEAAKRFDSSSETKLLTYATPAIESAMMDYGSHSSLTISIPPAGTISFARWRMSAPKRRMNQRLRSSMLSARN